MQETIYLAGGCFWGVEKYISLIHGVIETEVGYANGHTNNPTYEDVCRRGTGHAEVVRVEYDESLITLEKLLSFFYASIDPTQVNRQGNDVGSQYRSGIYYMRDTQKAIVLRSIKELQNRYIEPIAIEILPIENYFRAEEYHQKYLDKNPNGYCHVDISLLKDGK